MRKRIGYRLRQQQQQEAAAATEPDTDTLWLVEDAALVLLGGEVWPSAFAMAELVESRLRKASTIRPGMIVELGAGAGLCALVAAAALAQRAPGERCRVFLTDESPELAAVNAELFRETWLPATAVPTKIGVEALELSWGDPTLPPAIAAAIFTSISRGPLLVLGCELTPMPKTQRALVATLRLLLEATEEEEGTALLTVDACVLQLSSPPSSAAMEYPRVCPLAAAAAAAEGRAPCAGHRFLALAEAEEGGMDWSVERIWTAEEVRAACRARRVRREQEEGEEDFGAATAPEGLVLVALTRRRT